jgi:hypothetical protein
MTHEFLITAGGSNPNQAVNLAGMWLKGTEAGPFITRMLQQAYPGVSVKTAIRSGIVPAFDQPMAHTAPAPFMDSVNQISRNLVGNTSPDYAGIRAAWSGQNEITVYDYTAPSPPVQIQYTDIVGMPTWIDFGVLQVMLIMRHDITNINGSITLPPVPLTSNSGQNNAAYIKNSSLTFQGTFSVTQVRHIGNFRSPDGTQWVTIVNAFNPNVPGVVNTIDYRAQPTVTGGIGGGFGPAASGSAILPGQRGPVNQ